MLAKQATPRERDLAFLRNWMKKPKLGCIYLLGSDRDIWKTSNKSDLIAVKRYQEQGTVPRSVGDFIVRH